MSRRGVNKPYILLLGPYSAQAAIDRRVAFRASDVPFTLGLARVLASIVQWLPAHLDPWRARGKEEARRKLQRPLPNIVEPKQQPTLSPYHIDQKDVDSMIADDLERLQTATRHHK